MESAPSLTILLAEDDAELAFLIIHALEKEMTGYEICRASDGGAALARLHQEPRPVLLVTDLNMPGMNGIELIERMKKEENLRAIPIIVFSSSEDPSDHERCKRMQVADFLQKKSSFHELCHRVGALLSMTQLEIAC